MEGQQIKEYPVLVSNQVDSFKREQIELCGQIRESIYDILAHREENNLPETKMLQQGSLSASNSALKGGITYIQNQSVNIQVNTSAVECLRVLDSMMQRILMFEIPERPKIRRRRKKKTGER